MNDRKNMIILVLSGLLLLVLFYTAGITISKDCVLPSWP